MYAQTNNKISTDNKDKPLFKKSMLPKVQQGKDGNPRSVLQYNLALAAFQGHTSN